MVRRSADPDDRRAQLIILTEAGQLVVDEFVPHLNQVLKAVIFDTLSAAEITVLIDLLTRIEAAAQTQLDACIP